MALHEPIYGAYTELYAGLSTDIGRENNGLFGKYQVISYCYYQQGGAI